MNLILTEQRAQRHDLFVITKMLRGLINDSRLQKQVDEYFDSPPTPPPTQGNLEDNTKDIPEEKWDD